MNDRYLYRAKRTDNGEWVEGFYAVARDIKGLTQHNILIADNDLGYFKWIVVDPSTICQCTGLKDKNGRLIFENDVVYARCKGLSGKGIIKFEQGCFVLDDSKRKRTYSLFGDWILRVDGNIFDNPELLEVEE